VSRDNLVEWPPLPYLPTQWDGSFNQSKIKFRISTLRWHPWREVDVGAFGGGVKPPGGWEAVVSGPKFFISAKTLTSPMVTNTKSIKVTSKKKLPHIYLKNYKNC